MMARDSRYLPSMATTWSVSSTSVNVWDSHGSYLQSNNEKNSKNINVNQGQLQHSAVSDDDIDSYAQKVLEEYASAASKSIDEVISVDRSLGAYVANRLRQWKSSSNSSSTTSLYDVTTMPDYQALCELLQEHCSIDSSYVARQAMEAIAQAVFDRRIPSSTLNTAIQTLTDSLTYHGLQISTLSTPAKLGTTTRIDQDLDEEEDKQADRQPIGAVVSPLAADSLIPLDLLDDPVDPPQHDFQQSQQSIRQNNPQQVSLTGVSLGPQTVDEDAFPPLSSALLSTGAAKLPKAKPPTKGSNNVAMKGDKSTSGKSSKGYKADDLVATLFRHGPRSRQSSIDDTSIATNSTTSGNSPSLQALHASGSTIQQNNQLLATISTPIYSVNGVGGEYEMNQVPQDHPSSQQNASDSYQPDLNQEQLMMMIHHGAECLLSMNPELSMSAALAASDLCQGNVSAAQYLINLATSAPPICRHLLNAGCYRADCQFSHDIESHTCIFWLKGRCSRQYDNTSEGNTNACRFLHGFHLKLVDEIPPEYMQQDQMLQSQSEENTYHQQLNEGIYMGQQYGIEQYDSNAYLYDYPVNVNGNALYDDYGTSSWGPSASYAPATQAPDSFANIASQGYNKGKSFVSTNGSNQYITGADVRTLPTIKIPQGLWNPHENRDSGAFHIANPLERYFYVKNSVRSNRDDVIDLHFQSLKTFPIVLDTLFEDVKVGSKESGGTWIITGTGHHVGTQTHQKGGGTLEQAVLQYLVNHYSEVFSIFRGRDRNGQGGAIMVIRKTLR